MVKVSERWFGFPKECERMKVHVEDGVDFIRKQTNVKDQNGTYLIISQLLMCKSFANLNVHSLNVIHVCFTANYSPGM